MAPTVLLQRMRADGTKTCPQFNIGDDGTILPPTGGWPSGTSVTKTGDYPLLTINRKYPCS